MLCNTPTCLFYIFYSFKQGVVCILDFLWDLQEKIKKRVFRNIQSSFSSSLSIWNRKNSNTLLRKNNFTRRMRLIFAYVLRTVKNDLRLRWTKSIKNKAYFLFSALFWRWSILTINEIAFPVISIIAYNDTVNLQSSTSDLSTVYCISYVLLLILN